MTSAASFRAISASRPGTSHAQRAGRALLRDKAALASGVVLLLIVLLILLASLVSPRDPLLVDATRRLAPPLTQGYILGSDEIGRDILSRLLHGGRTSLTVAIVPVLIATTIGGFLGMVGGYFQGRTDTVIMRTMDVVLAFPSVLLAIGVAAALGPGTGNLMIALVVVAVPSVARVVRASVLQASQFDYVLAARAVGASHTRIAFTQILPNVLAPVIVFASLETARTMILASGLSFLGLGVQPPQPDWGAMLATGRQYMIVAPHVATVPGLVIFLVTLSINTLGDGLRDAWDPRLGEA